MQKSRRKLRGAAPASQGDRSACPEHSRSTGKRKKPGVNKHSESLVLEASAARFCGCLCSPRCAPSLRGSRCSSWIHPEHFRPTVYFCRSTMSGSAAESVGECVQPCSPAVRPAAGVAKIRRGVGTLGGDPRRAPLPRGASQVSTRLRPKQRQQVLLRRAEAAEEEAVAGASSAESAAGERASAPPNVRTGPATNLASQPLHRRRRRARLMMRARKPSCCSRPMQPVAAARAASLPRIISASRAVLPTARAARAQAAVLRHGLTPRAAAARLQLPARD